MRHDHMRTPIFFRIWFAFVAAVVVVSFAGMIYLLHWAVTEGPEAVGKAVGSAAKAYEDTVRQ